MRSKSFDDFREYVLKEPVLQNELTAARDFAAFVPRVLEIGQREGYDFTEVEVEAAWRAAQRGWIERWL